MDKLTPVLEKRMDQIFIQQITGGNFNIASGGSTIIVRQQDIAIGNWNQLEKALENSGVAQLKSKNSTQPSNPTTVRWDLLLVNGSKRLDQR